MPEIVAAETRPELFPRTRWSVVLAAARESCPGSAAALEILCCAYWYPLYVCVRRFGLSPHDAQDLTQEFFCRLLQKRWLDRADPAKGRLRTFLITALKRFMANEWRRARAQKRGAGNVHVPIDTEFAESRYAADTASRCTPEEAFDRQWALTVLELTIERLETEFVVGGKASDFAALKGCLAAAHGTIDYGSVARQLQCSEGAARVAVHRVRRRFREIYREIISQTLSEDTDLDAELRHLAQVLARG